MHLHRTLGDGTGSALGGQEAGGGVGKHPAVAAVDRANGDVVWLRRGEEGRGRGEGGSGRGAGGEREGREMRMAHLCTTFTNIGYMSPSSFFLFMADGPLV